MLDRQRGHHVQDDLADVVTVDHPAVMEDRR
jgi:hypothetical protein